MSGTLYSTLPAAGTVAATDTLLVATPEDQVNPYKRATAAQLAETAFTLALGVAAAGAGAASATVLTARANVVTGASAGQGVALGAPGVDGVVVVVNDTGVAVDVYPSGTAGVGTINGGAAGAAVAIAAGGMATFFNMGAGVWIAR